MSYETTRAADLEASRRVLERERIRERQDALILIGLVVLWVAGAVAMALGHAGVMP